MLIRWPAFLIITLGLGACQDADLNIPDRNSMGISQPLIEIYAPPGDAVLPADTPFTLDYAILRSAEGHHVKIRIDNEKPEMVIRLKGKHLIRGLPAGQHRIRITEYTKNGRKTGGDITLTVTMQASEKGTSTQPDSP